MKGKDLQKIIRASGIKLDDLVELSGIKKRTISSLYEKEVVEAHYLEKIKKAGIELQNIAVQGGESDQVAALKKEIEHLKNELKSKEQVIAAMEISLKTLQMMYDKQSPQMKYTKKEEAKARK